MATAEQPVERSLAEQLDDARENAEELRKSRDEFARQAAAQAARIQDLENARNVLAQSTGSTLAARIATAWDLSGQTAGIEIKPNQSGESGHPLRYRISLRWQQGGRGWQKVSWGTPGDVVALLVTLLDDAIESMKRLGQNMPAPTETP